MQPRRTPRLPLLLLLLTACGGDGANDPAVPATPETGGPAPWFVDEAAARGIDFVHRSGHEGRYLYPEIVCGGGALFDMDGDGDLDAYLVQSDGVLKAPEEREGNRLYRNDGSGHFEDVTEGSGADDRGYGIGVATGDYDSDGDVDLYVTNLGQNALLRNDGGGHFTDVTEAAGAGTELWSTSAAFFDYDRDGDLDLWVVNYLFWTIKSERTCYAQPHGETYCGPLAYDKPAPDSLFRNNGDGTFTDVTGEAGVREALGNGLGIGTADFNGDGWLDVFVANDGTKDHLWINQGGERFLEKAVAYGCAADQDGKIKAGMGVGIEDLDEDGDEDLLVVNLNTEYDSFFLNQGTHFVDRTASVGLTRASQAFTRFGVGFHDFDLDGYLDLYEANGRVSHGAEPVSDDPFAEENLLYRGGADGRFRVVEPSGGVSPPLVGTSRGAAFGDVDGDGGPDVLVFNKDAAPYLLMDHAGSGNWLQFRVVERDRDALGAYVTMQLGDRTLSRRVRSSTSYCVASDPRVHVGLGTADGVQDVRVEWVDGTVEDFGARSANQTHALVRGQGSPVSAGSGARE